jgi:hypothetical protein
MYLLFRLIMNIILYFDKNKQYKIIKDNNIIFIYEINKDDYLNLIIAKHFLEKSAQSTF